MGSDSEHKLDPRQKVNLVINLHLYDLIKELTELAGPIGHEQIVQQYVKKYLSEVAEEVRSTRIGNILAHLGGSGQKIVIEAHADEICHTVQSITDDGFVKFIRNYLSPERVDPFTIGQKVLIIGRKEPVPGLFATSAGHILFEKEKNKLPTWDTCFIDLGLGSKKEVEEAGVYPGAPILWNVQTHQLGAHIVGKAMDDRVGLALMIQLAHELETSSIGYDLYFASTIQEEMGLLGAQDICREERFDFGIALDVAIAGDIPGGKYERVPVRLGGGPVVVHRDAYSVYNPTLSNRLVELAHELTIPIQEAAFFRYGSDGKAMLTAGVPNALLAWPTRYTHSPFEMINEQDLHKLLKLLTAFLSK